MATEDVGKQKGRSSLSKTIIRVGEVAGALTAIGGFLGDFLKPLASINLLVFATASVLTVLLLILCLKKAQFFGYGFGMACFFCLSVAIGFGSWWSLAEFKGGKERGFLAEKFAFMGRIQSAVLDERKVTGGLLADEADKDQVDAKKGLDRLALALDGFPLNVLDVKTIGDPRRLTGSGDDVTLAYDLTIGVDSTKYDVLAEKLTGVLDAVARQNGEEFTINMPIDLNSADERMNSTLKTYVLSDMFGIANYDPRYRDVEKMIEFRNPVIIGNGWDKLFNRAAPSAPEGSANESSEIVFVNTSRNELGDRTNWRRYDLRTKPSLPSGIRVNVAFLDSRGREITRDFLDMNRILPGLSLPDPGRMRVTIISPFTIVNGRSFNGMTLTRSLKMTPSELKAMSTLRCTAEAISKPSR